MRLMQSWLPAQGSGMVVLRALPIVMAMLIQAQFALGFGAGSFEPVSTLDAYVAPQDLDLQAAVVDFVNGGVLSGRKSRPKFLAPSSRALQKTASPKSRATVGTAQGPALKGPMSNSTPASEQVAKQVPLQVSPFQKWKKPKTGKAQTEGVDEKAPRPQLARLRSKPARPLPSNTAVATDSQAQTLTEAKAQPLPARRKSQPKQRNTQPQQPPVPAVDADKKPSGLSAGNLPPLTNSQLNLRKKIRRVLTHYYNRPLNTRDRSPWELMHAMLAFEANSKVLQGGPNGKPITAVGWLCFNQACKRRTLMYVNDDDQLSVRVGPALQGHRGQLLSMLAQSRINENYPLLVEGHQLKIVDLIEMEKRTCYPRTELTFKLIALSHYLDSDATWINDQGMEWSIPKLIDEEIRQPVRGAACGGTHRLSGLTLAYKTREARGKPVDGQYLRAKKFVNRYQQYAYRLQNRDGSFSTEWFRGPGNEKSVDRKLKTTGHILEWLLYAANDEQLHHWKTTRAANYLANIMHNNRYKDWESGPLGHAIHALLVYDRMVFSPYDAVEQSPVANQPKPISRRR